MATGNPFAAPARLRAIDPDTTPKAPGKTEDTNSSVPVGTIAEVKRWVGEDSDRAVQALEAEENSDSPRTTLVSYLKDISD